MLKLVYYGQNDGAHGPDVILTGDPGTDNVTLLNAGYLGGKVVSLFQSATVSRGTVIIPCDSALAQPYGFLINGPGEFAGAIGPSGSGKISVVRAMPTILVDAQAYNVTPTAPYIIGAPAYCGTGAFKGLVTSDQPGSGFKNPIGIIMCVPTATFPWLGIAALI